MHEAHIATNAKKPMCGSLHCICYAFVMHLLYICSYFQCARILHKNSHLTCIAHWVLSLAPDQHQNTGTQAQDDSPDDSPYRYSRKLSLSSHAWSAKRLDTYLPSKNRPGPYFMMLNGLMPLSQIPSTVRHSSGRLLRLSCKSFGGSGIPAHPISTRLFTRSGYLCDLCVFQYKRPLYGVGNMSY